MSCELTTIERWCSKTHGGLKQIILLPLSDISAMPVQYQRSEISNNITMNTGVTLVEIEFDKNTASIRERARENDAGKYYEQTISLYIKRDRTEVHDFLTRMGSNRAHLVITDWNGQKKIIYNVKLSDDMESGESRGSRHGTSFNFTAQSIIKAPFWTGSFDYA
jgi:hypothetical protein